MRHVNKVIIIVIVVIIIIIIIIIITIIIIFLSSANGINSYSSCTSFPDFVKGLLNIKIIRISKCKSFQSIFTSMGYSRRNPHLPDGWHAGNSCGRGGGDRGLWKSRWEAGLDLKLFFGHH